MQHLLFTIQPFVNLQINPQPVEKLYFNAIYNPVTQIFVMEDGETPLVGEDGSTQFEKE